MMKKQDVLGKLFDEMIRRRRMGLAMGVSSRTQKILDNASFSVGVVWQDITSARINRIESRNEQR
jgi:hypothetical protein